MESYSLEPSASSESVTLHSYALSQINLNPSKSFSTEKPVLTSSDLSTFQFKKRWKGVTIYLSFLVIVNVGVLSAVWFVVRNKVSTIKALWILASILAITPTVDSSIRSFRLYSNRPLYGPLTPTPSPKWHLDFTMWLYTLCLTFYAIPLTLATVISSAPMYFFLLGPGFFVLPVVAVTGISLMGVKLPVWISSDKPGEQMKPVAVTVIEDIGAVDFRFGKEWRETVRSKYASSPSFRLLTRRLTLLFLLSSIFFIIINCIISFTQDHTIAEEDFSIPFSYASFFIWLATTTGAGALMWGNAKGI